MLEAVNEFPFVDALPKREKSKLAKAWDLIQRMNVISETEGTLLPLMLAAKAVNLSRTRVDELCRDGRLKRIEIDGHVFITENSLVELCKEERKHGRPLKIVTTIGEAVRRARSKDPV